MRARLHWDPLPETGRRAGEVQADDIVDARGSTVQLANGYLYLDAAADPARALVGYDAPAPVEADERVVAAALEGLAQSHRCVALADGLDAATRIATGMTGRNAVVVDALFGEPRATSQPIVAVEHRSLGRSGAWLASSSWKQKPDLVVIGETIAAGEAFAAVLGPAGAGPPESPSLGTGGAPHPEILGRVAAVIETVKAENLLANAARLGAYLIERLESVRAGTDDIAAIGALPFGATLTFRSRSAAGMKRKLCERGVLVGLDSDNRLVILPPLVMRPAEVDVITGALRGALHDVPTWRPSACCPACQGIEASA
jgi:4-aminobutyrate aminotransferase-like enzyme